MAKSGQQQKQFTNWDWTVFEWEVTSRDAVNQTSTISWSLKLKAGTSGKIISSARKILGVTIDGSTTNHTVYIGIENNTTKTLASGTRVITHNPGGTKTFSFSYLLNLGITFSDTYIPSVGDSGTFTLDPFENPPTISHAPNFTDESASVVMYYNNQYGSGLSVFQAGIGIFEGDGNYVSLVPFKDISKTGSEYKFTFTESEIVSLRTAVLSGASAPVFYALRYNLTGTTRITTKQATFTIINPEPLLNPTVEDTNSVTVALTGNKNVIVKNASNASFVAGAQGVKGATIAAQNCNNGFMGIPTETGVFEATQSGNFKFWIRDSRNFQLIKTITKTTIDYFKPTCNLDVTPPSATDTVLDFTVSGDWFNGSFGAKSNTLTIQYRYKVNNGSFGSWTTLSSSKNGDSYTASGSISNINYKNNYTIEARAKDRIYTIANTDNQIVVTPVFDWSQTDFNFNVPVKFNGSEIKDFVVEEGEQYGWYYRKWNNGAAECWYTATVNNIDVGAYQLNGFYYSGSKSVSFPFTFTKVYYTSATGGSTANMNIVRPFSYTDSSMTYLVVGMQDVSNVSIIVNLEAKGRWK